MYSQFRVVNASSCLALATGHIGGGGGVVVCQPAHRTGHGRNHATRGTQGTCSYGGCIQLGPDAREALPRGGRATGRHRPQAGAGDLAQVDWRGPRLRLKLVVLHARPDRCPLSDLGHLAFDAIGGGKLVSHILTAMEAAANTSARRLFEIRVNCAQAGLHLRWSRPQPHNADEEFRLRVGSWRMVAHPVSREPSTRTPSAGLRSRVAAGLKTTFASSYTGEVSLVGLLDPLTC